MAYIVKAVFGSESIVKTDTIYQYNSGQVLQVEGLAFTNSTEFHLAIHGKDTASIITGTIANNIAKITIPEVFMINDFCTCNYRIDVFVYVIDNDSGYTKYKIIIPVKSRPRPKDYYVDLPTVPELKSLKQELNTAVNNFNDAYTEIDQLKSETASLKEDTAALQKRQNVLVGSEIGNPIAVDDAFSALLCGLNVYGRSTQDGTPTPDAPVPIVSAGDGGSVTVKVTGKNLLHVLDGAKKVRGLTITAKDGLISISGTATDNGYADLAIAPVITSSVAILSSSIASPRVKLVSKTWEVILTGNTADKMSDMATRMVFIVTKGQTYDLTGIKVQLELGSTATAYSPYREQILTLPTPNGLPGIPVTSGGNYTDTQGQQWVCDEVDLERGMKVLRIDKGAFDATKVLAEQSVIRDTPIETPLPPAEIAAYKVLTAYAPDTVVQASDGAGVKLEYQKDVNIAIKKLEDAIASMTTT